jgi:hypothetical protein
MVNNNLPIWCRENFSVRPEPVEGWTEKLHPGAANRSYFDKLSTNDLPGDFGKLFFYGILTLNHLPKKMLI